MGFMKNIRMIPGRVIWSVARRRVPSQLVIQFTDHCNATCPQCGMRRTSPFERRRLDMDEVRRIIDAAAARGVSALSLTGGEPMIFADDVAALLRHAGASGIPYLRTGTNGFFLTGSDKPGFEIRVRHVIDTLADTSIRNFWISIDSSTPGVHESMRGFPGIIEGIRKALPWFHDAGIYPSANLGINRNLGTRSRSLKPAVDMTPSYLDTFRQVYTEDFREFYRFVTDLGFTIANACYPMSLSEESGQEGLSAVYGATATDMVVQFHRLEKAMLFPALAKAIVEWRPRLRIFSPLSSLHALERQYGGDTEFAQPCRGGLDFFFIDARDGNTYPCGYRGGESMGKFWEFRFPPGNRRECRRCDWECFRDPSELMGPFTGMKGIGKLLSDEDHRRMWWSDMRYYRACDLFDGRRPPDYGRMARAAGGTDQ